MSRLDIDHTVACNLPLEHARKITLDTLRRLEWRISADHSSSVDLAQGSQFKTRFIGGWICKSSWFPAIARVQFMQTLGGVNVVLRFEEKLGIGILDPLFKQRYTDRFNHCINEVGFALTQPSHAPFAL